MDRDLTGSRKPEAGKLEASSQKLKMQNVPKIVRDRLKTAAPAVNHPDADLLTAFTERSLPEVERALVLDHLAHCGDCRDIVALALPEVEPTQTVVRPAPSGWLAWPALRWGFIAAGIVAVASVGFLQFQRHSLQQSAVLKQTAPVQLAANEPRKAVDQFVSPAPAEQKQEKLQAPATPGVAGGVGGKETAVEKKSSSDFDASARSFSSQTKSGTNTFHGNANVGGPHVANQQQNSNSFQNQLPAAPPTAFGKPHDFAVNGAAPAASGIAGSTSQLAQTQLSATASGADAGYSLTRAKPLDSRADGLANNAPGPARSMRGQFAPGQIGGRVVDPSGGVIANARVTITPTKPGKPTTTVTDSQGAWLIAGLPTGSYRAQANAPGFATTALDLNYDAEHPSPYSITLSLGSTSQMVEVAAAQPQVQTDAAVANTISSNTVNELPINSRSVAKVAKATPALLPRWSINAAGALQRSFDQGATWQNVDVNANSVGNSTASLEISAEGSRAKAKDTNKALKRDASALTFRAVAATGAEVWAGGSAGALYHSQDAGNRWTRVFPTSAGTSLTGDVVSLDFPDSQHGKLSTSTSEVWTTSDAGQSWQKQ